jgi:hypothetical protein
MPDRLKLSRSQGRSPRIQNELTNAVTENASDKKLERRIRIYRAIRSIFHPSIRRHLARAHSFSRPIS